MFELSRQGTSLPSQYIQCQPCWLVGDRTSCFLLGFPHLIRRYQLDTTDTTPATPGNRTSATKAPWVRWAVRCFKATWWGYKLWEAGHKLVSYLHDPESWVHKALTFVQDFDWSWLN